MSVSVCVCVGGCGGGGGGGEGACASLRARTCLSSAWFLERLSLRARLRHQQGGERERE
jgi:hypothetical protein